MNAWHRPAAVAGRFYPEDSGVLRESVDRFLAEKRAKQKVIAAMAPHAGYVYSGKFTGNLFSQIEIPERVVILCPNHTGKGKRISVWAEGNWATPLGEVPVDEALAAKFLEATGETADRHAHLLEHAIEVQLPFLQRCQPNLRILPITLGPLAYERCRELGDLLAEVLASETQHSVLMIASSDMSHYIPEPKAKVLDKKALDRLVALDDKGLYQTVCEENISMCGFIPTTVTLKATSQLGGRTGEVLSYGSSGETTGDFKSVVAYAAARFS